jgi:hypothetical protein
MLFLRVLLGILLLYFTHRKMTSELSDLLHRLGGNQNWLIWVWSVVFLPGTIIHEISHFLAAAATGTRTGQIEIFPEFIENLLEESDRPRGVSLGSVQVARMNPLQGFIVGLAPFISGTVLLIWLSSLIQVSYQAQNLYPLLLQAYLFFVIANSFFPSWSDIKQTLPLFIITLIAMALAGYFGLQFTLGATSPVWPILTAMTGAIFLSLFFNLIITGILVLLNHLRFR